MLIVRTLGLLSLMILVACGPRESLVAPVARGFAEPADVRDVSLLNDGQGVRYDESVDGDLLRQFETVANGNQPPVVEPFPGWFTYNYGIFWRVGVTDHIRLRQGVNTVLGSSYISSEPVGADFDGFTFDVPKGMELRLDESTYGYRSIIADGDGQIRFVGLGVEVRSTRKEVVNTTASPNGRLRQDGPRAEEMLAVAREVNQFGGLDLVRILSGAEEPVSPIRLQFFGLTGLSPDPSLRLSTLPAGQYRLLFGMSWSHSGRAMLTWNYALRLVLAPVA
jgi:hypothetical protein